MSTRVASLQPASTDAVAASGRALPALAGAVSAGLAVGISEAIAGVLPGATSLVAAVGQRVIDLQPPGAKDVVVALFGTNDKLALEVVVTLAAIAIGAGLGMLAMRRFALAAAGFVAFGGLGFVAALADPNASAPTVAVEATVAVGAGLQALSSLLRRREAPSSDVRPAVSDPARRSFLLRSGAVGIGAVAAGIVGRSLIERSRTAPTPVGSLPPPSVVVPPLAAGADLAPTTPGLTSIVVPNDRFYRIDTALLVPSVDVNEWSLRVHGLVDRESTLTWDELLALPQFEQYVTISCVSNEVGGNLVGNAKWTGIRLRDVLALAGVQPSATQLVGRSVDNWTAGMPLAWVMDPEREPMIAVQMNDAPLPRAHGFPARLIIPGLYGYVSATKWLTELELTTWEAFDGYWVPLGWSKEGPILTQSRIDTPRGSAPQGRVAIAGVAWAPDRGIGKVEVSIDGTWYDADLSTSISDATWVQWVVAWDATPGRHTLTVRATDGDGELQEQQPSPPAPDGARGWHTISVNVG
ncbi:MAG: molybdopterin-dependent oxidoreductase [Candidatus Limnocylindrales bacterium]